jgi:hypothetical protein
MSGSARLADAGVSPDLARVAGRRILVFSPTIRYRLEPGDRALVAAGDAIVPGTPIVERTLEPELVEVGRIISADDGGPGRTDGAPATAPGGSLSRLWAEVEAEHAEQRSTVRPVMATRTDKAGGQREERRRPPVPGKWWVGGGDRRGKQAGARANPRLGGTLLFEANGRWYAAAGERHEIVESPVAGTRLSAQAISRARAMSIRGLIAGSVGEGELRDLEASRQRQKASLAPSVSFGLIALDGHGRRPLATPILALQAAMAGREVAIVTDPPLLVFDAEEVPLPELPPDWIRVRTGPHAGREGRWLRSGGSYRFRGGIHLEAAVVRFADETETAIVPVTDLERFVF